MIGMDAGGGTMVPAGMARAATQRVARCWPTMGMMLIRSALIAGAALLALSARAAGHGFEGGGPELPGVLLEWSFDPLAVGGIAVAAIAYLAAVRRVDGRQAARRHRRRQTWFWMAGLAAIALALVSPIEAYEGALFSVHMVQHLLLEVVAAPLLVAGAPITLALRVASRGVRRRLVAILHSRALRLLAFPVVTWLLFAAVNWGWHFSTLYDEALESVALHYVQHATFLGAALLFWWPVLGADPHPWRMPHPVRLLYVFLAMPQNSFLGVALLSATSVLYPHYLTNHRDWGHTALEDQQLGGVIMWVAGDIAFLAGMVIVVALWMRHEERRTRRLDARLAAQRAADPD